MLITFVTVLNVAVAAALPKWSHVMQRAKEQELIFRGLQYAEAIRVFQARFGRYPVSLEELVEVNPRCIRRLWKDPMNPEGKWGLVSVEAAPGGANLPGAPDGRDAGLGRDRDDDDEDDEDDEEEIEEQRPRRPRRARRRRGDAEAGQRSGPILGVRSLVEKKAIIRFEGGANYSDWRFTPDLIEMPSGVLGMENVPRLYSRWFGRPLPDGIEAPGLGSSPTGLDEQDRTEQERDPRRRNRGDRRRRGGDRGG
ncbi:MAG: hypothetical protein R3325_01595 [Thermoanaerobaculia bacterium]|nr:hypothetical protein [Thermoanaerobaculia bacterium]